MHSVIQVLEPCTLYIVNSMVIFPTTTQTYMTINVFFFFVRVYCFRVHVFYYCCLFFLSKGGKFKRGVYFVDKNNEAEIARMLADTKIYQSHHLQYSLGLHLLLKVETQSAIQGFGFIG